MECRHRFIPLSICLCLSVFGCKFLKISKFVNVHHQDLSNPDVLRARQESQAKLTDAYIIKVCHAARVFVFVSCRVCCAVLCVLCHAAPRVMCVCVASVS